MYSIFAVPAIILAMLVFLIPPVKVKLMELYVKLKQKFMWNGTIRTIQIAFIQMVMMSGVQIKQQFLGDDQQLYIEKLFAWCIGAVFLLLPPFTGLLIFIYRHRFE